MANDTGKPVTRIRSEEIRRALRRGPLNLGTLLRSPGTGSGLVVWLLFAIVCSALAIWAREQPLVAAGRVMNDTATVRVPFEIEDHAATEEARKAERQKAPRVYLGEEAVLRDVAASIENLPKTVSSATSLDQVEAGIREQFRLTPEGLAAVQREVTADGEPSPTWRTSTARLVDRLVSYPLLDPQTWQKETQNFNRQIELRLGNTPGVLVPVNNAISVDNAQTLADTVRRSVADAGFTGPAAAVVTQRLITSPRPTFRFDAEASKERQEQAAATVPPKLIKPTEGQVIYTRGEVLTGDALDLYKAELAAYAEKAAAWQVWLPRASTAGAVAAVTAALCGYAALFCPRVRRNPARAAGIAGLLSLALAVACWATVADPRLVTLAAVAPTVFVAVILVIAYDRRVALAFAALHGILICTALDQPIGIYALIITGVGVVVVSLREIRDRTTLIRMSVYTAFALALGTIIVALIDRPMTVQSLDQTVADATLAGAGGLLVGMVTLFILPTIERAFDVTTSMTLIELRDPKQPLLRELQQRAPGTYNHSLNVANLAEAAADSIKVNGLLAYVGALYHDIGKMNKPEYFVENQTPGINKHDKLSPAMSLLVIIGHVKDGMELAREFALPKALHHFIEAHHGTTLVEYFYHRARKMAAAGGAGGAGGNGNGQTAGGNGNGGGRGTTGGGSDVHAPTLPDEIEYRYPGPKPRSKEVAIVMLCDAVESAARSMPNPTPSRIEAVVRALATKRLMDGQFDECDLTLRELNTVVETVSKTLASIYHGRVAYPEPPAGEAVVAKEPKTGEYRLEVADEPMGASEAVGRAG